MARLQVQLRAPAPAEGLRPARGSRGGVSAGHPPATHVRAAPGIEWEESYSAMIAAGMRPRSLTL